MIKDFNDMMEFVTGENPDKDDIVDAVDFKATKGKIIFFRRQGDPSVEIDGFTGEFMGSMLLENGKWIAFFSRDGSVRVLPDEMP